MKSPKLNLPIFSFFLLIIFYFQFVTSTPNIRCPGPYNCTCQRFSAGNYRFICGNQGDVNFFAYLFRQELQITCENPSENLNYNLLKGIEIGQLEKVTIDSCALPESSFLELTRTIGVDITEGLTFRSRAKTNFTKKHFSGLEHVRSLDLSQNGLTHLPNDLLEGFSSLTVLNLNYNNLSLHKNNFITPSLKTLYLGYNHITEIEGGVFANLTNLISLYLNNNNLTTLSRSVFSDLISLDTLAISENPFMTLPVDVFNDLKTPFDLYMYSTNISVFPEGMFSKTKLKSIYLTQNKQLLSLPDFFLSNIPQLDLVSIAGNNVSTISENTFWNSSFITKIFLQGNRLKSLPLDLFRDQIRLKRLDLDDNLLECLPYNIFKNLVQLEDLDLSHNRLKNISREVFYGLNKLRDLKLDNNQLHYFDGFPQIQNNGPSVLPKLYKLTLDNNKIERLGSGMVKFLEDSTELQHLRLDNNPWICDCSTKNLVELIKKKSNKIQKLVDVTCEADGRSLVNLTTTEICVKPA